MIVGPAALRDMVGGRQFWACGEPSESDVARIREQLPVVSAEEASILGNRDLFGRLATTAMLPRVEEAFAIWKPGLVLRDPCEYASALCAARHGVPVAQIAISLAAAERASIAVAEPALDRFDTGLVTRLLASPYVTRFPESLDPSPFPTTIRIREQGTITAARPLPDWWDGSRAPLVYVSG